jgi:hypothetical protein
MSRKFDVVRDVVLPAPPETVWAAVTEGSAGWLWPIEFEAHEGGSGPWGSTITAWEPPRHFANHAVKDDWFNTLEYVIEPHEQGAALHYEHRGVFVDNWDSQYDAVQKHTDFYLHTLGQYVEYFAGRSTTYVAVEGLDASNSPGGFSTLRTALGISARRSVGDELALDLPGVGRLDVTIDYLVPEFVGLRGPDALYCFFGRNFFGAPVGISHHLFAAGIDQATTERVWTDWLNGLY